MQEEIRTYPLDKEMMLNVIWDMMEIQHGETIDNDIKSGRVSFRVKMYDVPSEYHFLIEEKPNGCTVSLITNSHAGNVVRYRAFALLESLIAKPQDTAQSV